MSKNKNGQTSRNVIGLILDTYFIHNMRRFTRFEFLGDLRSQFPLLEIFLLLIKMCP